MRRAIDNLILAYGALTFILVGVFAADFEGLIHLSEPISQGLATYFKACIVIGFIGAPALIIQHYIYLRRRKQEREKLSRTLDSPDESPVHH